MRGDLALPAGPGRRKAPAVYRKSAAYYDLIYRDRKDYAREAAQIAALLNQLDPKPKRLLDVGCGTGEHAKRLVHDHGFAVDGIDIEPTFIEIAAAKLPQSTFQTADMQDFSLPQRYDAILCLFSSIGYVETESGLRQAFQRMAAHLNPAGWLLVEPWIEPDTWVPGQVDTLEVDDLKSGLTVKRTRRGETDGHVSILRIEYEVRHADDTSEHLTEEHRLGLFTREQMTAAARRARLATRWTERADSSAGLLLANRLP